MRKNARGTRGKQNSGAARAPRTARGATVSKLQLAVGVGIVALSAAVGFWMGPAVGCGLAVLAGLRSYALWREVRRQSAEGLETAITPGAAGRSTRAATAHGLEGRTH